MRRQLDDLDDHELRQEEDLRRERLALHGPENGRTVEDDFEELLRLVQHPRELAGSSR